MTQTEKEKKKKKTVLQNPKKKKKKKKKTVLQNPKKKKTVLQNPKTNIQTSPHTLCVVAAKEDATWFDAGVAGAGNCSQWHRSVCQYLAPPMPDCNFSKRDKPVRPLPILSFAGAGGSSLELQDLPRTFFGTLPQVLIPSFPSVPHSQPG